MATGRAPFIQPGFASKDLFGNDVSSATPITSLMTARGTVGIVL